MKKLTLLLLFMILPLNVFADDFTPRLSPPSYTSPFYTDLNVFHKYGYGMAENGGNCTCYAYGRAYEILGRKPNLSTGNAGGWYDYNIKNGFYTYGSRPKTGAIAVWKSTVGGAGHVAVVEKIEGDIAITSESGWNSYYFKTVRRNIKSENFGASSAYEFQGFIYILDNAMPKIDAKLSKSGNKTTVEIELENAETGSIIIVTAYRNGAMSGTEISRYNGYAEKVIFEGEQSTIKVMLRDKNNITNPLAKTVELW